MSQIEYIIMVIASIILSYQFSDGSWHTDTRLTLNGGYKDRIEFTL